MSFGAVQMLQAWTVDKERTRVYHVSRDGTIHGGPMARFTLALVCTPIIVVDFATFWSTAHIYRGFEPLAVAFLLAMALVSMQTGSLVLVAQKTVPGSVRDKLRSGVGLLMSFTALANVAAAYERGAHAFPAAAIAPAFGFSASPGLFTIVAAWVSGAVLVVVAFIYWTAVANAIEAGVEARGSAEHLAENILREAAAKLGKKGGD